MKCVVCGGFSSARTCHWCSQRMARGEYVQGIDGSVNFVYPTPDLRTEDQKAADAFAEALLDEPDISWPPIYGAGGAGGCAGQAGGAGAGPTGWGGAGGGGGAAGGVAYLIGNTL